MTDVSSAIKCEINDRLGSYFLSSLEFRNESMFYIDSSNVLEVLGILKRELGFIYLEDLTAVDYLEIKSPRFEVVYHLYRFGKKHEDNFRIRVKTPLADDSLAIDSVTSIWSGANWLEREVYDMFGIVFDGHPNLQRILMPEDYDEFPLRKDFDVRNREPSKKSFKKALKEGNF